MFQSSPLLHQDDLVASAVPCLINQSEVSIVRLGSTINSKCESTLSDAAHSVRVPVACFLHLDGLGVHLLLHPPEELAQAGP